MGLQAARRLQSVTGTVGCSFKIAIIGAGSVGFTRKLFADILCVPEFADIEVALTDISQHNLE